MIQMFFSQIQQATGPDFRTVGKSLLGKALTSLLSSIYNQTHAWTQKVLSEGVQLNFGNVFFFFF